jgi:hypothetical protein
MRKEIVRLGKNEYTVIAEKHPEFKDMSVRFYKRNNDRSIGSPYFFGVFSCMPNALRSIKRAYRDGTLYEESFRVRSD